MKKTYIQPTLEVVDLNPRAIMLNGSFGWNIDDTATIIEEEGYQDDYD